MGSHEPFACDGCTFRHSSSMEPLKMLSTAIDQADPDAPDVAELLDGIPGAYERARAGLEQARSSQTVPLDAL
jgi:hypothetical protein